MDDLALLMLLEKFKKRLNKVDSRTAKVYKDGERGPQGPQGPQGATGEGKVGPKGSEGSQGPQGPQGASGADGNHGTDGADGEDGVSVVDAEYAADGDLVFILSDGSEISVQMPLNPSGDGQTVILSQGGGSGGSGGGIDIEQDIDWIIDGLKPHYTEEAPADGQLYGRKDLKWEVIPESSGGLSEVFDDKTPQLGGDLDALNEDISNVNKISSLKGNFGGAQDLRAFNVYGAGFDSRISLQGAEGGNPGLEMTTDGNISRVLQRLQRAGVDGTELQIWNQRDGGGIHMPFVFGEGGEFFIRPPGSSTDVVNDAGFRNSGGDLEFRNDNGVWTPIEAGGEGPTGPEGPEGPAGEDGSPGAQGPEGPTAVSTDADNFAVLGTDNLIYVPTPVDTSASLSLQWLFRNPAGTAPDPNYFSTNDESLALVTELNVSYVAFPNREVANLLGELRTGDKLYLQQGTNESAYANFDLTGEVIDNGTYYTIPVSAYDSGVDAFEGAQVCSFLIFRTSGSGDSGGGVTPDDSLANSKGAALALEQSLLAKDGQPALTVLAVGPTNTGKVQGCSLGNGNVVEVYASGADFNNANVLYREFMSAGEPICFTGLSAGAIITSTQGFYGISEQIQSSNESPMPLLSLGLAFTGTFLYAFRNSNNYPGEGNGTGQVTVVNGPLPSTVTFTRNGNQVRDQEPRNLEPFELTIFYTDANGEFFLAGTSPVMACIQAYMGLNPPLVPGGPASTAQRFYDARLVMPLTNDGITWPRSGNVSAPYDNTTSKYYVRDGVSGDFPTISPGAPVDFDSSGSTGANDSDYEPRGATRLRVNGLAVAYSGADSAGLEASPMMPVSAMSQVVAQPFWIDDTGDGGNSGVAIASPYEGTAKVYAWNSTTGVAELAYTVPLGRGTAGQGIAPATPEDQYIPCAGLVANEAGLDADPSVVQLVGNLAPGYIVADVPITVVAQNATATLVPEIRSQNGTTTTSIVSDDDETLMLGWTPAQKKAEITEDADGYTRKRVLDNTGAITWPLT